MSDAMTLGQATDLLRNITMAMRSAADELAKSHEALADTERDYRIGQAHAWHNEGRGIAGKSSAEREVNVAAETADLRHARDIAKGRIDSAKANLSRLDREAASVRFLGTWAQSERGSAV